MICTIALTILVSLPNGKEVRIQRHFTQQSLEQFHKDGSPLNLPAGQKLADVESIQDFAPFKCGSGFKVK